MPGLLTRKFRIYNAQQFLESVNEADPSNLYFFIARQRPWANDANPPTPVRNDQFVYYDHWRDMMAAKKVVGSGVSLAIPRYNWANGVVYRQYDPASNTMYDVPAASNTFYAMTDLYNVYKCLFNNGGVTSTIKPTGTSFNTLVTSDGYEWKYMFTVTSADRLKFVTQDYIPVDTLTANNGTSQWDVQQNASNSSVDVILVSNGGSGYLTTNGQFQSVSNGSSMALANTATAVDNIYNGSTIYITAGKGATQIKGIINYVGTSRIATLNSAFTVTPNTSSQYLVSPKVNIVGDGRDALAYSNVHVSNGAVNRVIMINEGVNYSKATVTISSNTSHGGNATARALISPPGGHGSDAIFELVGKNVMVNVEFSGSEANTFPTTNDFRIIGLLRDPKLANTGTVANGASYRVTTALTLTGITGSATFTQDELISGGTSGSSARVIRFTNTNASNTAGTLYINSLSAPISNGEVVTGNTSGIVGTVGGIANSQLLPYTGDLMYIENRTEINRSVTQLEDIKLRISY